jgi:hypothetical protein
MAPTEAKQNTDVGFGIETQQGSVPESPHSNRTLEGAQKELSLQGVVGTVSESRGDG